ncbi:MAG: hypothetical protein OXF05_04180 [Hyphomicrobiales bacterium]|nr:hypothetical protein [Hyphomicrobiales bacterium]
MEKPPERGKKLRIACDFCRKCAGNSGIFDAAWGVDAPHNDRATGIMPIRPPPEMQKTADNAASIVKYPDQTRGALLLFHGSRFSWSHAHGHVVNPLDFRRKSR